MYDTIQVWDVGEYKMTHLFTKESGRSVLQQNDNIIKEIQCYADHIILFQLLFFKKFCYVSSPILLLQKLFSLVSDPDPHGSA